MKILLDSCAFIDLALNADSLTQQAQKAYQDSDNEIYISVATVWELGLKKSLGKLNFDIASAIDLLPPNTIKIIDITLPVTLLVNELPYHHKDPFDRIIIASAKIYAMSIMTSDKIFDAYDLDIIDSRVS